MPESISIKVSKDTHALLISRMMVRETFNQLIRRLLEASAKHRRAPKALSHVE